MILRKTFIIENWKSWDHEVDSSAKAFYNRFAVYPNVLLASKVTFSRIDLIADKDNIVGPNDTKPNKYQYTGLGKFVANNYELDFCIDDKLSDKNISLIYDSAPNDDDGEPVPKEDTEDIVKESLVSVA